jgi:hypothetical protein
MKIRKSITTQFITNPLYAYVIGFMLCLFVFSLKWSYLYEIHFDLIVFIVVTSIISILFGCLIKNKFYFKPIPKSKNNLRILIAIILGNIIEFVYCKKIPIVSIVFGGTGNYRDFEGIPTFHVFLSGISLFFSVYVFHQYQSNTKNKKLLWFYLFSLLPFILILNRGAIVLVLLSSVSVYMMKIKRIHLKQIIYSILMFLCFIFLFGIIGNIRDSSFQDNTRILELSKATDEFIENKIPNEFYWGYLYIASPIGNLQNAIEYSNPQLSLRNCIKLFITQTFPDFISKRFITIMPFAKYNIGEYLVTPILNAPTVYYGSYIFIGWWGMVYMFVFMIGVVYIYLIINHKSIYFLTGWSFLVTTIFLNIFNNMWFYNGLYLIFIPIILSYLKKIKIKTNRNI